VYAPRNESVSGLGCWRFNNTVALTQRAYIIKRPDQFHSAFVHPMGALIGSNYDEQDKKRDSSNF